MDKDVLISISIDAIKHAMTAVSATAKSVYNKDKAIGIGDINTAEINIKAYFKQARKAAMVIQTLTKGKL